MDTNFKQRANARMPLVGTFVKIASYQVAEMLGATGLDYIVVDAEHATFDRNLLDVMLLGARSVSLPCLVRIPNPERWTILSVLDQGASGIIVPHVTSAEMARDVVASATYRGGHRGFSPSPRFAQYGTLAMPEVIKLGDETATVICQIEDEDGLANVSEIAAVPGVDGLLIGRADLALAIGQTRLDAPEVEAAVDKIIEGATKHAKSAAIVVSNTLEIEKFRSRGATMFAVGTDQLFLQRAARQIVEDFEPYRAEK